MGGEAAAPAAASSSSQAQAKAAVAAVSGPLGFLRVLWRFTRPHTFIGTALCIPALTLYAAPAGAALLTPKVLGSILWALLPAGLINVYITGLNQVRLRCACIRISSCVRAGMPLVALGPSLITRHPYGICPQNQLTSHQVTDVEIDKINKPYLPIAAGQLSKARFALFGVGTCTLSFSSPTHGHLTQPHQTPQLAASVVVVASLVAGLGLGLLPSPFGSQALLWVLLW